MEFLRKFTRRFLGTTGKSYQMLSHCIDFIEITKKYSITRYVALMQLQGGGHQFEPFVAMSFKNLLHPLFIRPKTDDTKTIINNIIREEWGNFIPSKEPKWMIDAGAYIGDTSAYFLSRFKDLNIIALEPDSMTFTVAHKNLTPYGKRVQLYNCGLYTHEGSVGFKSSETSSAIIANGELQISVTTIPALLAKYSIERLDILKMDIEGAEELIFSSDVHSWLPYIDLLIIELHSHRGEELIKNVLTKYGFSIRPYRSVWYCVKIDCLS